MMLRVRLPRISSDRLLGWRRGMHRWCAVGLRISDQCAALGSPLAFFADGGILRAVSDSMTRSLRPTHGGLSF